MEATTGFWGVEFGVGGQSLGYRYVEFFDKVEFLGNPGYPGTHRKLKGSPWGLHGDCFRNFQN